MEAMILAAGLGTRLRPLTHDVPKALVEVNGVPMLERTARRLIDAGADRLIINIHHHADAVRKFVEEKKGFGVEVEISEEPGQPFETGGGIKYAEPLFKKEAPFIVHNSDILTDLDLKGLYAAHQENDALATLACRTPETNRYLIFDESANLAGYATKDGQEHYITDADMAGQVQKLDFCGVQVISPEIFGLMTEEGVFSIINVYVRLVRDEGERIVPFRVDGALWQDIGTHERLEEAHRLAAEKLGES